MNKEKEDICYGGLKGYGKTYCEMIRLQQENTQLKEQLEKKYEKTGTLTTEILYEENTKLQSVLKELRRWLEEQYQEYKETEDERGIVLTSYAIDKLNELEGGKND